VDPSEALNAEVPDNKKLKLRVRTIPSKAPNIQYAIILASSDTNAQYQYEY